MIKDWIFELVVGEINHQKVYIFASVEGIVACYTLKHDNIFKISTNYDFGGKRLAVDYNNGLICVASYNGKIQIYNLTGNKITEISIKSKIDQVVFMNPLCLCIRTSSKMILLDYLADSIIHEFKINAEYLCVNNNFIVVAKQNQIINIVNNKANVIHKSCESIKSIFLNNFLYLTYFSSRIDIISLEGHLISSLDHLMASIVSIEFTESYAYVQNRCGNKFVIHRCDLDLKIIHKNLLISENRLFTITDKVFLDIYNNQIII